MDLFDYIPSELTLEYKAVVNIEIGLLVLSATAAAAAAGSSSSEDQVLWDTADIPLTEAFTS